MSNSITQPCGCTPDLLPVLSDKHDEVTSSGTAIHKQIREYAYYSILSEQIQPIFTSNWEKTHLPSHFNILLAKKKY